MRNFWAKISFDKFFLQKLYLQQDKNQNEFISRIRIRTKIIRIRISVTCPVFITASVINLYALLAFGYFF
jgi:hypothetical protein